MQYALDEIDPFEEVSHPLDFVEETCASHKWDCHRASDDAVRIKVPGRYADYAMMLMWEEELSTLQFTAKLPLNFDPEHMDQLPRALLDINAQLWLGHFTLAEEKAVLFRHAVLFRGITGASGFEHVEDLITVAREECDRFFPFFQILQERQKSSAEQLILALSDTEGAA